MRTRSWKWQAAALGLTGWVSACVPPALASEVTHVSELARAPIPLRLGTPSEGALDAEVKALLARPLDVHAAVRVALLNNRDLQASLQELGVARGELWQASLTPNPEFELEATPPQGEHGGTEWELAVEYDLTSAVLSRLRANTARAGLKVARLEAAASVIRLQYDTRAAFYALQAAEQQLALAHQSLDGFAAGRDAARALLEAGNVAELDATTQEAAYENARVAVAQLELDVLRRREQLQRLLGLHGPDTRWALQGPLPGAPEALSLQGELESKAVGASLELARVKGRLEQLSERGRLVSMEGWLPDVAVGLRGERGEEERWTVGASLRFTLPVVNRNQGTTASVSAGFDAESERLHALGVEIRSAAREAHARVAVAHGLVRHYERTLLPARQRVLRQTLLQYNAMQVGVFQLLQARRDHLDTQLTYVDALRDYWTAVAALDALLAGQRVEAPSDSSRPAMAASSSDSGGH